MKDTGRRSFLISSVGLSTAALSNSQPALSSGPVTASGDSMVGAALYPQTAAEIAAGVTPTNYAYPAGDVRRYGADSSGATDASTAIQSAINTNSYITIPSGSYLTNSGLTIGDHKIIEFTGNAKILAGSNGMTVFLASTSAYYTQFWNPVISANGKTNVTGFDLTNFRVQSAIYNAQLAEVNIGFIFRTGCYATAIINPSTSAVPYPIQVIANCGALDIINPFLDNETGDRGTGAGIGIDIQDGGTANESVNVVGGAVQGFQYGIKDAGFGTRISDTYFEENSSADVYGLNARTSTYRGCGHFANTGGNSYAYTLRACDGVTIFGPTMGSGNRTALYNVDNSNTNCVEYHATSAIFINTQTGTTTYLTSIPKQTSYTFTPVIVGSSTAGTGTYSVQAGLAVVTGSQVHVEIEVTWSAHSGTGNITVTGIPSALTPSSYSPRAVGMLVATVTVTNAAMYAYLNGDSTKLSLMLVSVAGSEAPVPIAGSGTVRINLVYTL